MLRLLVSLGCAGLPLSAQFAVGTRDVAWPNTTGQGSTSLTARVHYPATSAGSNAPILPRAGGWPVVVFLHGFATAGTLYGMLGNAFAERGYAVVVSTTATFDNLGQERDGLALFPAVLAANQAGVFAGAFDASRIALAGHSMGGGNVGNILAANPGYRCGLAIAPVEPRAGNAAQVTVPLAITAGQGDTIAPAAAYAVPYYQSLGAVAGIRSLYLLNGDATHTNLAGLFVSGGAGAQVFARVTDFGDGWFAHWLGLSNTALERCVGPAARAEPRLVSVTQAVTEPQLWLAAALTVGSSVRASVASEPGLAGVVAAWALGGPSPTPFGTFRLDPASAFVALVGTATQERRFDGRVVVPNDPVFAGLGLALQAFGSQASGELRFGNAFGLAVAP